MSSTPSASALTAVLRCRGNIWSRNPPTKRPGTSAYSLGLAGGAVGDPPAERPRTHQDQAPTWEAFLHGERVVERRRLAVAYDSSRVDMNMLRENGSREIYKCTNLSQSSAHSPRDAHPAACGAQNALVRQLALKLLSNLPGTETCCQIIQMIKYEKYAAHICKTVIVQETGEFPTGSLKVSITSSCLLEHSGQIPSFVLTGWSTLKNTCLSLTALMSEIVFCKLAVLCRSCSSPEGAPAQQLLRQQDAANVHDYALQANGQIHSPTVLSSSKDSAQQITEDRPD